MTRMMAEEAILLDSFIFIFSSWRELPGSRDRGKQHYTLQQGTGAMDKDMHYCVVKILALKAGFTEQQAELIGYASQYVDDAVENKPMRVHFPEGVPEEILNYERYDKATGCFDPTCTAYRGIHWISVLVKPDIQKKVYVAFHLVPAKQYPYNKQMPLPPPGDYSYLTEMGSVFVRAIVDECIRELENNDFKTRKLIKLGIALHAFADTYSHYGFSGRNSCSDNDRKDIRVIDNGEIKEFKGMNRLESMLTPRFAHAVALAVPDTSHLEQTFGKNGATVRRSNPKNYLKSAEEMYTILTAITGGGNSWDNFRDAMRSCIEAYVAIDDYAAESPAVFRQKFDAYGKAFGLELEYSEDAWRQSAVKANSYDWINYSARNYRDEVHEYAGDMRWYYFHMGAFEQRKYILDNVRPDLK